MAILKNLKFVPAPARTRDPIENQRLNLIAKLDEQKKLLEDPNYVRTRTRFTGKGSERKQVTTTQRVRPWWRTSSSGAATFAVYHGARPIEFEKGREAIAVQSLQELNALLDTLIAATRAGELDALMSAARASRVKKKKAA